MFSPDGTRLATSHQMRAVMIWDVTTGEQLLEPLEHPGSVYSVAFSLDGNLIATAGADKTVRFWDAKTGQELLILKGHTDKVYSVAFSPDGSLLVTASEDKTVRLWDAESGQQLLTISSDNDAAFLTAIFSHNGQSVLTTDRAGQIQLWQVVEMISHLRKLEDGNADERRRAVLALGNLGSATVPVLVERLEDPDPRVREAAAHSLGQLGGHALAAVGALKLAASDEDRKVHSAALQALVRIDQRYAERAEAEERAEAIRKEEAKLTAAIQKDPTVPKNWIMRGRFYLRHQQWRKAASDFEHDLKRDPNYDTLRCDAAFARLAAGDLAEYRQHCQMLETRFDKLKPRTPQRHMLRVFVMEAESVTDFEPLMSAAKQLAESTFENSKGDPNGFHSIHPLGPLCYRNSQYQECVDFLARASDFYHGWRKPARLLWLAMAHHQLGHEYDAESNLNAAIKLIDELPKVGEDIGRGNWIWIECQVIRREAEALIRGSKSENSIRLAETDENNPEADD